MTTVLKKKKKARTAALIAPVAVSRTASPQITNVVRTFVDEPGTPPLATPEIHSTPPTGPDDFEADQRDVAEISKMISAVDFPFFSGKKLNLAMRTATTPRDSTEGLNILEFIRTFDRRTRVLKSSLPTSVLALMFWRAVNKSLSDAAARTVDRIAATVGVQFDRSERISKDQLQQFRSVLITEFTGSDFPHWIREQCRALRQTEIETVEEYHERFESMLEQRDAVDPLRQYGSETLVDYPHLDPRDREDTEQFIASLNSASRAAWTTAYTAALATQRLLGAPRPEFCRDYIIVTPLQHYRGVIQPHRQLDRHDQYRLFFKSSTTDVLTSTLHVFIFLVFKKCLRIVCQRK